jgi:outer membrane protein TolC
VVLISSMLAGCGIDRGVTRPAADRGVGSFSATRPAGPGDNALVRTSGETPEPGFTLPQIAPPPTPMAGATPPAIPVQIEPYPIDLTASLRLADVENPRIAEARVAIIDALAQQAQARTLLLPSLNAGITYHAHNGNLQRSSGRILRLSEQSLYIGGGARTLAAETVNIPAINIFSPITEAIFEPLVARQRLAGAELDASATANTVLLEVTTLFFELLGAQATREAVLLTASEADVIAKIVADYAATGQGRKSDSNRADAERRLLQGEIQHAEEQVAVASARLSRRLNLDATVRLRGLSGPLEPLSLVDPTCPHETLIRTALARRPDLGARSAIVGLAGYKLREEQTRPLLPIVSVGFSGGAYGGGSNIAPPLLSHFGSRTDFDVRATWTLLNFGVGNASLAKRRKAEVGEAIAERSRVINQIRSEVLSARAESQALRRKVEINRAELASAEAGYREDFTRLRETVGLPIEMIDSLKLLNRARVNLIESIVRANQAEFSLFVAMGSPPPLDPNAPAPLARPPIANPLASPIVWPKAEAMPHVPAPGAPLVGK